MIWKIICLCEAHQIEIKKKYQKILFIIVSGLFVLLLSCNAPRENPVDPNNEDNNLSKLSGIVKSLGYPFAPIENVAVFWGNNNILIRTDQNGKFNFQSVIKKNGWLRFECDGYSSDSTFIDWTNSDNSFNEIFLNSKPKLDSLQFFSVVINRFQFKQKHFLEVRATISDFEGINDIVTVQIENKELRLQKTLVYNPTDNYYTSELSLSDLNSTSLNEVIGKDFRILVKDLRDEIFEVGVTNIKRIINEEIELISPISNETSPKLIRLKWIRFIPGFDFTYKVEIYTNEASPSLVYFEENISQNEISHFVNEEFDGNNFFWVIWAIDEFNNQSRSKEGSFIIEE